MMREQGLSIRRRGDERRRYLVLNLALAALAVVAVAGCAQQPAPSASPPTVYASPPEQPKEVAVPTATVTPEEVAAAAKPATTSIGVTVVGQKVAQFRSEFEKLKTNSETRSAQLDTIRARIVTNVEAYHALVAAIRSRLQMGSTPGNPELLAQWNQAQTQLTEIDNDVQSLNKLSAQVSADAATSAYLLDSIRASFSLSGAVEEDHRQLHILEDAVSENAIIIDRALQGLNDEINRQEQYVAGERTALVALAADINAGQSYETAAHRGIGPRELIPASPASFGARRPLVVIRFDKANVAYEPALYQALSRALERRPDAVFDLVAVSPEGRNAGPAKLHADAVLKSMTGMGLPSDRVSESAITSPTAKTPEVHIYVR